MGGKGWPERSQGRRDARAQPLPSPSPALQTREPATRARAQSPPSDSGDPVPGELGVGGEGLRCFWGSALRWGHLVWRQQSGRFAVLCGGRIPIHSTCPISEHRAEALKRDFLPLVLGIPPPFVLPPCYSGIMFFSLFPSFLPKCYRKGLRKQREG